LSISTAPEIGKESPVFSMTVQMFSVCIVGKRFWIQNWSRDLGYISFYKDKRV